MKHKYVGLALMLICISAMAYVTMDFPGWQALEDRSKEIIIVKCKRTPSPTPIVDGMEQSKRGLIDTDVEVLSVLKGTTNAGITIVRSQFWPRQDEYYLVFSSISFGCYQANERYRVVPLGMYFPANDLTGKKLNEQIRLLLQFRLHNLNRQMAEELKEKERLETVK